MNLHGIGISIMATAKYTGDTEVKNLPFQFAV